MPPRTNPALRFRASRAARGLHRLPQPARFDQREAADAAEREPLSPLPCAVAGTERHYRAGLYRKRQSYELHPHGKLLDVRVPHGGAWVECGSAAEVLNDA